MGQIEIYELLKIQRLTGNDEYLCVNQVQKLLKDAGYTNGCLKTAWMSLAKLNDAGYLDSKMSGDYSDWKRLYRLKDKYVKGDEQ